PDRQSGVAGENVEEQLPVGGQLGWLETGCEGEGHQRAGARTGPGELQHHAFWLEPEPEHIGPGLAAVLERQVGYRSEVHGTLLAVAAQCLAGPEPEDRANPAPII